MAVIKQSTARQSLKVVNSKDQTMATLQVVVAAVAG